MGERKTSPIQNIDADLNNEKSEITEQQWFDTINFDSTYIPDITSENHLILPVGIFHSDEVWDSVAQQKWIGLFKGERGYYNSTVQVQTNRVYDIILDDDDGMTTGWEVKTLNPDSCLLLINNDSFLDSGMVNRVLTDIKIIIPGDTLKFFFKGKHYSLFATGGKLKVQDDFDWYELWNYKLYLSSSKNGNQINQLIVAIPRFRDTMLEIQFIGDIDADDNIDLIINTSNHYNAISPTLYLSKPADSNSLLKIIGTHKSTGC